MKTTTAQLIHPVRQPASPPPGERAGVRGRAATPSGQRASQSFHRPLTLMLFPDGGEERRVGRSCRSAHSWAARQHRPTPLSSSGQNDAQRGFSRLELLVVLLVLLVLASLFVPALARESARDSRAFCLHRLGQLARAMAMYAADTKDYLPPNPDDGNTTAYRNWCGGQAGVGGSQEFNPDILRDPTRALLTPYMGGNISYYKCPADLRTGMYQGTDPQWRRRTVPSARTVSLNGAVGTSIAPAGYGKWPEDGPWLDGAHSHTANKRWYCFGRMSDFVRPGPAHTFTFIEEDARSLNDAHFGVTGPKSPPFCLMIDWPATYHEVAGGVAFADGHVEMHRWVDKRTPVPAGGVSVAPQSNNPDLIWLTERASALIAQP